MTKQMNGKKISAIAMGALALGIFGAQGQANASTKIDSRHVQVEAGDTLGKIADEYDTTVDALVKKNNISNEHLIHVGDKLTIVAPKKGSNNHSQSSNQNQGQVQVTQTSNAVQSSSQSAPVSTSGNSAKDWIASRESGGSYTAQNGRYYGKYQLDLAYLGGDLSPQHQEEVADQYVISRYGSWAGAQAFWASHNWY